MRGGIGGDDATVCLTYNLFKLNLAYYISRDKAAGVLSGLRRICPNIFQRASLTRSDRHLVLHISYSLSFEIV